MVQFGKYGNSVGQFLIRPNIATIVDKFVGTNMDNNNILKNSHISSPNAPPPPFPQSNVDNNLIHCGDYCDTYCNNIVLGEWGI